jgi:hypothetical protein
MNERETGLEPATPSLGKWTSIENQKKNGVYGGSSRFKEISNFPNSAAKPPIK